MKPLRIVLMAPMVAPIVDHGVPLGGAQVLVADLAHGLAAHGHQVTLLAAHGSSLSGIATADLGIDAARLAPALFMAPRESGSRTDLPEQRVAFERVRGWLDAHLDEIDLVHGHAFDGPAFDSLAGFGRPVLHTLHLPPLHREVVQAVARVMAATPLIAVSHRSSDTWRAAGVRIGAVVPNAVDTTRIPFGETSSGYVLFAGRLTLEKGAEVAIAASRDAGHPLVLVGAKYDVAYYEECVRPLVREAHAWTEGDPLDAVATWIGPRPRAAVHRLMSGAIATLVPSRWEEPFGLVTIEAQAAGSPVIAFDRGGLGELIVHGRTGKLVPPDDGAAFARAVREVQSLDRAACRAWVTERFDLPTMIKAHEALYRATLAAWL